MLQFNAHEIFETRWIKKQQFKDLKFHTSALVSIRQSHCSIMIVILRHFIGKHIIIKASRPLTPNDMVAENYGPIFSRKPLQQRQRSLLSRYWFKCECNACTYNWPQINAGLDGFKRLEILQWCERQYEIGFEVMNDKRVEEAIGILCEAIEAFHRISRPPHQGTSLAQECLQICEASFGNVWVVPTVQQNPQIPSSALVWIVAAWKSVSQATILKCFAKGGFLKGVAQEDNFDEEDEIPLAQLVPVLKNMPGASLENYARIDCNVVTENPNVGIQEIIGELIDDQDNLNSESDVEESEIYTSNIKDMAEVCEKLRDIQTFLFSTNKSELAVEIVNTLTKCESLVLETKIKNLKQTSIDQYFKKM
nr:unnamed protein product [Callosobruchus analis]